MSFAYKINNDRFSVMGIVIPQMRRFVEHQAFGVCTRIGDFTHVSTGSIRLFFIYASFLTLGSPVIVYMALAFVMNMRKHLRQRRSPVWDL
jgi:phage shock protein C